MAVPLEIRYHGIIGHPLVALSFRQLFQGRIKIRQKEYDKCKAKRCQDHDANAAQDENSH